MKDSQVPIEVIRKMVALLKFGRSKTDVLQMTSHTSGFSVSALKRALKRHQDGVKPITVRPNPRRKGVVLAAIPREPLKAIADHLLCSMYEVESGGKGGTSSIGLLDVVRALNLTVVVSDSAGNSIDVFRPGARVFHPPKDGILLGFNGARSQVERSRLGMTDDWVAKNVLRTTPTVFAKFEAGEKLMPRAKVELLASAYGVQLDTLWCSAHQRMQDAAIVADWSASGSFEELHVFWSSK